jgi:hypothetical protein
MAFEEFTSQGKVNAEQIEEARSVITPQGAVTGLPGQWEVRYPDGDVRVLDDDAFQEQWGGKSGESEEEATTQPTAEKSLSTRQRADAVSSTGDDEPITVDAGSASSSSRDSDERDTDEEPPKSTRKSRAKEQDDTEPPV